MFREVNEVREIKEAKKVESIFPAFFDSIQLDGASEIKEVHESKNTTTDKIDDENSIFPAFFKDIILK